MVANVFWRMLAFGLLLGCGPVLVAQAGSDTSICDVPDEMPRWGRQSGIDAYLKKKVNWQPADEDTIPHKVIVSFVVELNGHTGQVSMEGSVSPEVDEKILAALKGADQWIPARKNAQYVRARINLPIWFRLR